MFVEPEPAFVPVPVPPVPVDVPVIAESKLRYTNVSICASHDKRISQLLKLYMGERYYTILFNNYSQFQPACIQEKEHSLVYTKVVCDHSKVNLIKLKLGYSD